VCLLVEVRCRLGEAVRRAVMAFSRIEALECELLS